MAILPASVFKRNPDCVVLTLKKIGEGGGEGAGWTRLREGGSVSACRDLSSITEHPGFHCSLLASSQCR